MIETLGMMILGAWELRYLFLALIVALGIGFGWEHVLERRDPPTH